MDCASDTGLTAKCIRSADKPSRPKTPALHTGVSVFAVPAGGPLLADNGVEGVPVAASRQGYPPGAVEVGFFVPGGGNIGGE